MPSEAIDQTGATAPRIDSVSSSRALDATPSYWFSMFAASALGTNLGDFAVGGIGDGRGASFAVLAAIATFGILLDRRSARRGELGFWLAIITLRAAATNVGDFLTHDMKIGYGTLTAVTGISTLIAGHYTRTDTWKRSPHVDARYWIAMLIAGIFGTIGGDLLSHTVGLYAAAAILCSVTVLVVGARRWVIAQAAGMEAVSYWCVVLAERGAGTPFGDGLASHRALGLGLAHAMMVTSALLAAALIVRRTLRTP
jgi:uncharacterized membrane-anchored protein